MTLPVSLQQQTNLIIRKGLGLQCRYVDFFVTLALFAEGAVGQLATLVGHEMTPLCEGQVIEVQKLTRGH